MRHGSSFGVETVVRTGEKQAATPPNITTPSQPSKKKTQKKQSRELSPSPSHLPRPRPCRALARKQKRSQGGCLSLPPLAPLQITFQRISIKNSGPPARAPLSSFPSTRRRGGTTQDGGTVAAGIPPPAAERGLLRLPAPPAPPRAPLHACGDPAPPPPSPARRWGRQPGKPLPV